MSLATTTEARAGAAPRQIVLATRSAGKLRELGPLLATHGWDAITLDALGIVESADEEGLEQYDRFEENALAKARYFATRTGRLVLADDSGLAVEALDGRPGVHSKRWSGSALQGAALDAFNNAYLLERLREAEAAGRSSRAAAYECAAACAWPEGAIVAHGRTAGQVLSSPRGTGGFGYDPYFWSEELQATFAEVARDAKAAVSHRGRAVRAVLAALADFFPLPVDPTPRRG